MIALEHNVLLEDGVVDLIVLNQDVLSDALASVQRFGLLVLAQEHFAEGATTDHHEEVEVLKTYRLLIFLVLLSDKLCAPQFGLFLYGQLSLKPLLLYLVFHFGKLILLIKSIKMICQIVNILQKILVFVKSHELLITSWLFYFTSNNHRLTTFKYEIFWGLIFWCWLV